MDINVKRVTIMTCLCFSVLWDPAVFLSFVGADQMVTDQTADTGNMGLNRGRVSQGQLYL